MDDRHSLIAFLAVISAIVTLAVISAFKGVQTDLAIMTGLIGVLGTFRPRSSSVGPSEKASPPGSPVEESKP